MKHVVKLDKEREIKFTMGSFAMLAEKYGSVGEALGKMSGIKGVHHLNAENLNLLIDLAHAGLKSSDKKLTREDVADLLTVESLADVILKIGRAMGLALPEPTGGGENPPTA